jgi:hypothetical protein
LEKEVMVNAHILSPSRVNMVRLPGVVKDTTGHIVMERTIVASIPVKTIHDAMGIIEPAFVIDQIFNPGQPMLIVKKSFSIMIGDMVFESHRSVFEVA